MDNLDSLFADVFEDTPAQEAAETATEAHADDDGQQEGKDTGEENVQEKPTQDAETNSRQAEARRRREAREKDLEQRAYQAGWNEASGIVAELGIEKPDGSKITSMDDLKAYAADRRKERLAGGQATQADIEHIVDERLRQTTQKPDPAGNPAVQQQLAKIREMDPAMTDLGAILQSDAGGKFQEYVRKGLDFVDAYTLAARDRLAKISGNRSAAAAGGKDHLSPTSSRGEGALSVPPDVMAMYRELDPDMSEKEIQQHYNKDRKRFG